jgi:histidinol-phosphatase
VPDDAHIRIMVDEHEIRAAVDGSAPRRLPVSSVAELNSAGLSFSSLSGWAQRGLRERFLELTDAVWRVRAYGDFLS